MYRREPNMKVTTRRRPQLNVGGPVKRKASLGRGRRGGPAATVPSPTERTAGRRSRCRWAFILTLTLAVGGLTISEAVQYRRARAWGAELFLLETIRVAGAKRFSAEEILAVVDLSRGETDMADVVVADIHDAITAAFVDLLDVAVTRDVPAGALSIIVTERRPVARVVSSDSGDAGRVIDNQGVILQRPFALPTHDGEPNETVEELTTVTTDVPATAAGMFDSPEVFRAVRLMEAYGHITAGRQPSDVAVRLRAIDARDPSRIQVQLGDATSSQRTAVLAERTMAAGLRNVLLVTQERQTQGHPALPTVTSLAGEQDTLTKSADSTDATEIIDARFERTVYVKSIPRGQDG